MKATSSPKKASLQLAQSIEKAHIQWSKMMLTKCSIKKNKSSRG